MENILFHFFFKELFSIMKDDHFADGKTLFCGKSFNDITILFNCYLAVSQPTMGHSRGESLTNPMLIMPFPQFCPEGHR